ncbi:uncharacterized protein SPSK_05689 [Sporothrix schenckii 1099-18]|uniref:Uncharacterized protein n=1 Tax=Sporothrix schenckii 1099-18 TaxID=1397361 RepID=A0A0F2LWT8_SPOSC|nr:uncharacterized protein SPSK_05689 [Sporothrix schenckii 1099-18]KJR80940.1 hypothetical protein SPSK_05689 [Sporothrix schenckii 1099-18]
MSRYKGPVFGACGQLNRAHATGSLGVFAYFFVLRTVPLVPLSSQYDYVEHEPQLLQQLLQANTAVEAIVLFAVSVHAAPRPLRW